MRCVLSPRDADSGDVRDSRTTIDWIWCSSQLREPVPRRGPRGEGCVHRAEGRHESGANFWRHGVPEARGTRNPPVTPKKRCICIVTLGKVYLGCTRGLRARPAQADAKNHPHTVRPLYTAICKQETQNRAPRAAAPATTDMFGMVPPAMIEDTIHTSPAPATHAREACPCTNMRHRERRAAASSVCPTIQRCSSGQLQPHPHNSISEIIRACG